MIHMIQKGKFWNEYFSTLGQILVRLICGICTYIYIYMYIYIGFFPIPSERGQGFGVRSIPRRRA